MSFVIQEQFDRDEKNTKENKSMKEEFDELIKTIDALKSASNGFINMKKIREKRIDSKHCQINER
jgi:hypothetical protein